MVRVCPELVETTFAIKLGVDLVVGDPFKEFVLVAILFADMLEHNRWDPDESQYHYNGQLKNPGQLADPWFYNRLHPIIQEINWEIFTYLDELLHMKEDLSQEKVSYLANED
ncbi:hypothetical protein KI387_011349, partial [Taxus chinensis]